MRWTDTSNNEASFRIEREMEDAFTTNKQAVIVAANINTFSDTTVTGATAN